MIEFTRLVEVEKRLVRKQLRAKSANFMHMSQLFKKVFYSLTAQLIFSKQQKKIVYDFIHKKDENILEDYFLAWKQRTNRTELEK